MGRTTKAEFKKQIDSSKSRQVIQNNSKDIKKDFKSPGMVKIKKIDKVGDVENDSIDMENGNLGVGQESANSKANFTDLVDQVM